MASTAFSLPILQIYCWSLSDMTIHTGLYLGLLGFAILLTELAIPEKCSPSFEKPVLTVESSLICCEPDMAH